MARSYDIIKKAQDLSHLSWDEHVRPSGLPGVRAKAREGTGPNAVYYKKSHSGELGRNARDCFAELLSVRLTDYLGFEHAPYQLICTQSDTKRNRLRDQWIVRSKSYRRPGEQAIPLATFFELRGEIGETPFEFCLRMGWGKQLYETIVADYLTATRDRDASCFEVLRDRDGSYRLSPWVPRGFSFANAFPGQTWRLFPTANVNTTNYLGETSLEANLSLIPADFAIAPYSPRARNALTAGLSDVEPDLQFFEASLHILQGRWRRLESLRNL